MPCGEKLKKYGKSLYDKAKKLGKKRGKDGLKKLAEINRRAEKLANTKW